MIGAEGQALAYLFRCNADQLRQYSSVKGSNASFIRVHLFHTVPWVFVKDLANDGRSLVLQPKKSNDHQSSSLAVLVRAATDRVFTRSMG